VRTDDPNAEFPYGAGISRANKSRCGDAHVMRSQKTIKGRAAMLSDSLFVMPSQFVSLSMLLLEPVAVCGLLGAITANSHVAR